MSASARVEGHHKGHGSDYVDGSDYHGSDGDDSSTTVGDGGDGPPPAGPADGN
jgi:hypothetical protein